jgi:predicted neuraminidase
MRTDQGRIYQADSADRAATWGPPVASDIESPQAPFALVPLPQSGDWLLIWNPHADFGAPSHQGYRTPLRCAVSQDDGRTWQHAKDLEPDTSRAYCYVSVTFVGEAAVLSYYVGSHQVVLEGLRIARVPLAWFYA